MNLELLDPFRNNFPEVIEERLEEGVSCTCAFNRRGTLLATGCLDGRVIIWDFDTKGIAKVLHGHVHPVTSLSWTKDGKKLLSSSTDWNINLFEVLTGNIEKKVTFESPVLFSQIAPSRNKSVCIVCPLEETPWLVNLIDGTRQPLPESQEEKEEILEAPQKKAKISSKGTTAATFNKTGDRIFTGNSKGVVLIIETDSLKLLSSFKVPGGAPIKSILFSKDGQQFLINSTDRIIRVYEGEKLTREFQDPVNRMQWKKCCFSSDGEYLIGGSAQKSQHNIYIWNREHGQLIKTLEGPKEGIMDLVWHPVRPIIASISTLGTVYIWASNNTENWSAFAPDFKELEENEDYIEKEDEFDEEEDIVKSKKQVEDTSVDVTKVEKISQFSSDDENDLSFIPTTISPEYK